MAAIARAVVAKKEDPLLLLAGLLCLQSAQIDSSSIRRVLFVL